MLHPTHVSVIELLGFHGWCILAIYLILKKHFEKNWTLFQRRHKNAWMCRCTLRSIYQLIRRIYSPKICRCVLVSLWFSFVILWSTVCSKSFCYICCHAKLISAVTFKTKFYLKKIMLFHFTLFSVICFLFFCLIFIFLRGVLGNIPADISFICRPKCVFFFQKNVLQPIFFSSLQFLFKKIE